MTCIVGIAGKNGVLLAGDSQWSGSNEKGMDTDSKVFSLSPVMAMGCCGSGRIMQVLKHVVSDGLEDPGPEEDLRRWVIREFQPHMAAVLESFGALSIAWEDEVEWLGDSALLLAIRDRVFTIEDDFSVNEHFRPYVGIASGGETATGALNSEFSKMGLPDAPVNKPWSWMEDAADRAIKAAADGTLYVGGPIRFVRTIVYTPEEIKQAKKIIAGGPTPRMNEGWYE